MSSKIKAESGPEPQFTLKVEPGSLPDLGVNLKVEHEFVSSETDDAQFGNALAMDTYQEFDTEQKDSNMVANILAADDGNQHEYEVVDSNAYISEELDEVGQGEQFLTIPRGKTQITVCDNGKIVYTDDNILETINDEYEGKDDNNPDDSETLYYQDEGEPIQPMDTDDIADNNVEYLEQIIQGGDKSEIEHGSETITLVQDASMFQNEIINVNSSIIGKSEFKKLIPVQDSSRGVKRPILPSTLNKGMFTKVFVQNNASASGATNQPIKIIGNVGSVVGGRSMSLAQAQRLGLISPNAKVQQVLPSPGTSTSSPSGRVIMKKMVPQGGASVLAIKQPTKILPALTPKARTTIPGVRGAVSVANITPVRSNISLSQLKSFNALGSTPSQVRPVTLSRAIGGVTISKQDVKTPQKVVMAHGGTVLGPLAGQIARLPVNASFQPIQIGGKQQVQYVKLVTNSNTLTSSVIANVRPRVMKPVVSRTIPIAPSPVMPKPTGSNSGATVLGRRILLPSSGDGEKITAIQVKSSNAIPVTIKGKSFTAIKSSSVLDVPASGDSSMIVVQDEISDEQSLNQDDLDEIGDKENLNDEVERTESPSRLLEANGIRPKKPCNCTKSQCLKLYCECFANGEFCFQCNCTNCYNNIEHEDERQLSIRSCLDRNPAAFRPKFQIGDNEEEDRRHKGCNCKRSGCLKNYCECFEAKLSCSKACKCAGCRNNEDGAPASEKPLENSESPEDGETGSKSLRFMSPSLAEALCQCILAQAEAAERKGDNMESTERRIIEEFGQCLVQIIGNRNKRDVR